MHALKPILAFVLVATAASGLIGTVTFWGSLVAFGKLQGLKLFAKNVSESFVARIHDTPSNEIWFPTRAELVAAGVLQKAP